METNQNGAEKPPLSQESDVAKAMSDSQMLAEIYEFTRKTKMYMQWQMYITIILVVLPLLASLFIVPFVMRSLMSSYSGLLQ